MLAFPTFQLTVPDGNFGASRSLVRRVQVKVLRQDDVADMFDRLFPIDPGLSTRCARELEGITGAGFALIRQFMSATIQRLTQEWQLGDPHAPFSDESLVAHEAALAAGREFYTFMAGRDPAAGDRCLSRIGDFLAIVEAADPDAYAELIVRLDQLPTLSPECNAALEPIAEAHGEALAPVRDLLGEMLRRARSPGGGYDV